MRKQVSYTVADLGEGLGKLYPLPPGNNGCIDIKVQ